MMLQDQKKFKQNPKCFETRKDVELLLKKYAKTQSIVFKIDKKIGEVLIGEYKFTKNVFYELILYVWQGGLPRWKDNIQPDNVVEMKEKILASSNSLFDDIRFD